MKWLWYALLTVVSGVLYRLGGWIQTKIRDFGCALLVCIAYLVFGMLTDSIWVNIAVYLACFGATFGSLTTYWKKKGEPAKWWNWAITGFVYGLSALPLLFVGVHWYMILIRSIALSASVVAVSEITSVDFIEEFGRGALLIATVPLLVI